MNKEVKEIIDDIKDFIKDKKQIVCYDKETIKILLDYITSLEEKLETEHKAYMGTVKELTETATEKEKLQNLVSELSNQVAYQDIKIFSLEQILNKIKNYCDNSDDLYEYDCDYDYEEELIVDYVPSHFKENILNIIKGVDEDD